MTTDTTSHRPGSDRRSFLKSGALLAAPIVAATPAVALAGDDTSRRLARLEDERAIEALHRAWLRRFNTEGAERTAEFFVAGKAQAPAGAGCSILQDPHEDHAAIEISDDGATATCRYSCEIETRSQIEPDCTFAHMARLQGSGAVRRVEKRGLVASYVKADGAWAIDSVKLV